MFRSRRQPAHAILWLTVCLVCTLGVAEEPDPSSLLKSHGLKASGWVYILEKEEPFHSKMVDARSHYEEWRNSMAPLERQFQALQEIESLTESTAELKQYIVQLRQQMASLGNYRGRAGQYQRMQQQQLISGEVNQSQSNLNAMNQQLNQLKKNLPKPDEKKKAQDTEAKYRESLHDEVTELVKLSEEIQGNYHELHFDKDIEAALRSLSRSSNAKYKLGPSHEHLADMKILQKLRHELALGGSPVAGDARSKTKSHSKTGAHPKRRSPAYPQASPIEGFGDS